MDTSYDVLVSEGCSLGQVVEQVHRVTGHRLEEDTNEWGLIFKKTVMGGIFITAYADPELEDDHEMEFSRYKILVGFETHGFGYEGELREELCRIFALLTASAICHDLRCHCLVAKDLQQLVKTFEVAPEPEAH